MGKRTLIKSASHRLAGFTLVELLVAGAVFILMTTVILQLFGSVATTSNVSQRRLDILKQATSALDRLAFDVRNHLRTGGVTLLVRKDADGVGNDEVVFAAPVSSYAQTGNERQMAIVRYGIAARPQGSVDLTGWSTEDGFSREIEPLQWADQVEAKLTAAGASGFSATGSQQVAPGVIRLEVAFQLWDNSIVSTPPADMLQARALVVAVVALDKKAANSLSASELKALPARFGNASNNQRPSENWQGTLGDLPAPVRETLHVYEKTIPLSPDA